MKKQAESYVERSACPLYTAIQIIEGRWKPMIFQRLGAGSLGFGELRRSMDGVTGKVLRQQLRQLEAESLVTRLVPPRPGLKVHYQLTAHGRSLGPVIRLPLDLGRDASFAQANFTRGLEENSRVREAFHLHAQVVHTGGPNEGTIGS